METWQARQQSIMVNFLKNTSDHVMTIMQDDGVYRHLRFKRPDCIAHYFDVITYPGHLVYSGDMGCYVFTRISDMFNFFRTNGDELRINAGYWSEKLEAVDIHGDGKRYEWSSELHDDWVKDHFDQWKKYMLSEDDGSDTQRMIEEVYSQIESELLSVESEWEAQDKLWSWNNDVLGAPDEKAPFSEDWYEGYDAKQHPYRLIWAMFAINWGIKQYDKHHADVEARQNEKRSRLIKEQEDRDRLYSIYRENVEGAPFYIGQRVQSGRDLGTVQYLDYSGGCGESYPDDPMICVQWDAPVADDANSSDGEDVMTGHYWKEELEALEELKVIGDE